MRNLKITKYKVETDNDNKFITGRQLRGLEKVMCGQKMYVKYSADISILRFARSYVFSVYGLYSVLQQRVNRF